MKLPTSLIALQYRNFRLLWLGLMTSFSGSLMQMAAVLWHVSLLVPPEQRGLALGLVGLVRVAPVIVFSLISGVAADAFDRRKLLLVTQSVLTVLAALLAVITFAGNQAVWPIYLLTALSAAASSFDQPARASFLPSLVPREHLANALSLHSIMFQAASVLGPSLAGVAIATLGLGWVYAINAASFAAVIVALLLMRGLPKRGPSERTRITPGAAWEGLRFVFRTPIIRSTMLIDFFANFFATATALLPIFAQDILHVGAQGYGWLYAAPSVGALLAGAAMVRLMDRIERRGQVLLGAFVVYGAATILFGLSRSFWLTFLALALFGASDNVNTVLRNVIRQLATPDHLRGRMTGVNMMFYMGGPQLGELEAGLVADRFGAAFSVISGGVACLIAVALVAWYTPALRNYRREDAPLAAQHAAAD